MKKYLSCKTHVVLTSSTLYVPVVSAASEFDGTLSTKPLNQTYTQNSNYFYNGAESFASNAKDRPNSNISTESNVIDNVNYPPEVTGYMTGGGSVINTSIRVTHGFELKCDAGKTPNNLEVNWDKGNKFHLENLTTASCTDDPAIKPNPPDAGFDTYEGSGTGSYNGVPGASAIWRFTDAGEPGNKDSAMIKIWGSRGNLVLSVSGLIRGNHQAHRGEAVKLVSIAVTPENPAIALGETLQFTATGTYTDGSTKNITSTATWSSSNDSAATIAASGLVTSVAEGTTDITAAVGVITSPAQKLTVTAARLVSIAVTPVNPVIALGQTQQFTANGTYSDGSIRNITSVAAWKADNSSVATISDSGLATSVGAGTAQINATSEGISSPSQTLTVTSAKLVSIAVTPENPTIALGQTQQFIANGTYSDGSIKNITASAAWASSNTSVATIDSSGSAASAAAGTTQINASSEGITSPAQTLTVTSDILCTQDGWQYYRDITINNTGSALTDYQVLVNLTGSAFPTSVQPSGADLRFRNAGGAELSYWFEKWDYANRSALVWVNVTSMHASGDTSMRMYYGNPGAIGVSNGDRTFEFFDDFDGNDLNIGKWNASVLGSGSITVQNGYVRLYETSTNIGTTISTRNIFDSQTTIIDTSIRHVGSNHVDVDFEYGWGLYDHTTNDFWISFVNIGSGYNPPIELSHRIWKPIQVAGERYLNDEINFHKASFIGKSGNIRSFYWDELLNSSNISLVIA